MPFWLPQDYMEFLAASCKRIVMPFPSWSRVTPPWVARCCQATSPRTSRTWLIHQTERSRRGQFHVLAMLKEWPFQIFHQVKIFQEFSRYFKNIQPYSHQSSSWMDGWKDGWKDRRIFKSWLIFTRGNLDTVHSWDKCQGFWRSKDARMERPEMKQLIPIPEGYQMHSAGRVPGCRYHSNLSSQQKDWVSVACFWSMSFVTMEWPQSS